MKFIAQRRQPDNMQTFRNILQEGIAAGKWDANTNKKQLESVWYERGEGRKRVTVGPQSRDCIEMLWNCETNPWIEHVLVLVSPST